MRVIKAEGVLTTYGIRFDVFILRQFVLFLAEWISAFRKVVALTYLHLCVLSVHKWKRHRNYAHCDVFN